MLVRREARERSESKSNEGDHPLTDPRTRDEATDWFEQLYVASEARGSRVPWDRGAPHRHLMSWAQENSVTGSGRRAVVVGCGLGDDAEFIAALGFDTIGFDIAPSAIRQAQQRFPESAVNYVVADLFGLDPTWLGAFDLVVENQTVQALPGDYRIRAISAVSSLVAPSGTLTVLAARIGDAPPAAGPPWPLNREEIDAFATVDLEPVEIAELSVDGNPRWRAIFFRPAGPASRSDMSI